MVQGLVLGREILLGSSEDLPEDILDRGDVGQTELLLAEPEYLVRDGLDLLGGFSVDALGVDTPQRRVRLEARVVVGFPAGNGLG